MSPDEGNCCLKETTPEGEPTAARDMLVPRRRMVTAALESARSVSIDEAVPKLRPPAKGQSPSGVPCARPTHIFLCFVSSRFSA